MLIYLYFTLFFKPIRRYFLKPLYRYFWRPLVYWFHRPLRLGKMALWADRMLAQPLRKAFGVLWQPLRKAFGVLWQPLRKAFGVLWQPLRKAFGVLWRPLLKLALLLLFFSFFLGLPYTLSALLLGLLFFCGNFFGICKKAPRHYRGHRRLLWASHGFHRGLLFLFPFLAPLIYFFVMVTFQYLCGLGEMLAQAETIVSLPAPVVTNPHRLGLTQAIFDARLHGTGVTLEQMRDNIARFLLEYDRGIKYLTRLHAELAREEGLPPLEAPEVPPRPSSFWPANSDDWTFRDGARGWLWRLGPRLYTQDKPIDVGVIGLLNDPRSELGTSVFGRYAPQLDVRGTLYQGVQFNATFSLPDPPTSFNQDRSFMVFTKDGFSRLEPMYVPEKSPEERQLQGKIMQRAEEQPYRDGMAAVSQHLERYPLWRASILEQSAQATTFTELYEIHSEACLQNAQLLFHWHFGCYEEAKEFLLHGYHVKQMQFALMHPGFCRPYSFTSATCDTAFQKGERSADSRRLWEILDPYAIADINDWLGHLGRLSFYPLGAVKPTANEGGAVFHYWETLQRPPLVRDVSSGGEGLRDRMYGGHLLEPGQLDRRMGPGKKGHTEPN